MNQSQTQSRAVPYGGYFARDAQNRPADNLEILRSGPDTPMGEYLRRPRSHGRA